MKQYEVNIVARVETTQFVEAEDKEQACEIAEQEWGREHLVYCSETEEYEVFDTIIGYEPVELPE